MQNRSQLLIQSFYPSGFQTFFSYRPAPTHPLGNILSVLLGTLFYPDEFTTFFSLLFFNYFLINLPYTLSNIIPYYYLFVGDGRRYNNPVGANTPNFIIFASFRYVTVDDGDNDVLVFFLRSYIVLFLNRMAGGPDDLPRRRHGEGGRRAETFFRA